MDLEINYLTDEQLDTVSGGVRYPESQEEIDKLCIILEELVDTAGGDVAYCFLLENDLSIVSASNLASKNGITTLRRNWEAALRGERYYWSKGA